MEDNSNKPFDPFGLDEIENIQKEIESDLNITAEKSDTPEQTDIYLNAGQQAHTDHSPYPYAETQLGHDTSQPVEAAPANVGTDGPPMQVIDGGQPVDTTFYTETIKAPQKTKKRPIGRTVAILCLVCTIGTGSLGLGIGAAIPFIQERYFPNTAINDNNTARLNQSYEIVSTRSVFSGDFENPRDGSFADVYKLLEPAVVGVTSFIQSENFGGLVPVNGATGIIFEEDQNRVFIATNEHVVGGASSVNVILSNGATLAARPVGSDRVADLAVISIDKRDLHEAGVYEITIAEFGDSDDMDVGDFVLTIGNALGEGTSATLGIISAKEKTITIEGNRPLVVLQTDAAINNGNSGGPLINTYGEVIGINTAKLNSYFYSVEGIGYSISSNIAMPILKALMNTTSRPLLGIIGETLPEATADMYDIPALGVLVNNIISGSGADKGGIVRTDIITSINGNAVFTWEQLVEEIRKCEAGDTVPIKILREGKTSLTLEITLGERDDF